MNRGYSGGKRSREANRDLRKREKEDRLRRNRELRAIFRIAHRAIAQIENQLRRALLLQFEHRR